MTIPIKNIPGISHLIQDFFDDFERVRPFFGGHFREGDAFRHQTELISSRQLDRKTLAAVLEKQNRAWGCGQSTLENIEKLVADQASVVVTGQQVGLFSGPLYTIYKSITAIKLAKHLNDSFDGCVVPVFWLASDDHDFEEINHINLLDKSNQLVKLQYTADAPRAKVPASNIMFTSDIEECIQLLEAATHDSEF